VASNIRQRVLAKVVPEANELLRRRKVPEIVECTRTRCAGPTSALTLRIYQQLLKRKRREEYRGRVNELLGTSPAALSKLPDLAGEPAFAPKSAPNSLVPAA
jgi:hypothetical protein